MKILNKILSAIGKKDYQLDKKISNREKIIIFSEKLFQLVRGIHLRILSKKSSGLLFLGKNTSIRYKHKIKLGKTIYIGNNVQINALSEDGIIIGNNVSIHNNTIIDCTGVISEIGSGIVIGNNVGISQNCFIQVRGKVTIGDDVIIGPNVSIFSENHIFKDKSIPTRLQGVSRQGVNIGSNVWIGTKAILLDGINIGSNSVIAAGSVVTKDVEENTIVAGVPAKTLKVR